MRIKIDRAWKRKGYTISRVIINGERFDDGKKWCSILEDEDRGLHSDMTLEEIMRIKVKGATAIPRGVYEVRMTYSPKFGKDLPLLVNVPGYSGVRIHCLTPDTEVLTEKGWQNLEQFEANPATQCYTYNTEKGIAELKPINFFVKQAYDGELYSSEGRRINYSVTDKHRMYALTKKHGGEREWQWRTADDIPYGSGFLTAVNKDGEELSEKQKAFYRLLMAVQADGYIYQYSMHASKTVFHFTKQRKVERVKELITAIGETYTESVSSDGKTHLRLSPSLSERVIEVLNPYREDGSVKILPWELLWLKSEDLKDLLLEYLFFDGRWENYLKCNKNMIISSTNLHTLNVLQAMASLCGMRSYIHDGGSSDPKRSTIWEISLYEGQDVVHPESATYHHEHYNGNVWCLNNENHTLIIRRKNRVMVVSNCGNTALDTEGCLLPGVNDIKGRVSNSRYWYSLLERLIVRAEKNGEMVWIEVG